MRRFTAYYSTILLTTALSAVAFINGCQPATVSDTNANANTANANAASTANTNAASPTGAGTTIETREPETYSATLTIRVETSGGERSMTLPTLSADVARNGADRRISFKLPNGETLVYLDRADKSYVIAPDRKQYAELTPEAVGFQVPRMMTPGQIAEHLRKQKGFELAGEETVDGRTALKYRYAGVAKTGSQAGDVKTDTYVFIDKETGLPLKTEIFSEATGQVQGMKQARVLAEMSNIKTDVDPALFETPPPGMTRVEAEKVRQEVEALARVAGAILGQLIQNAQTAASPAATASPTATPTASPAK